jgi:hypothetical protein
MRITPSTTTPFRSVLLVFPGVLSDSDADRATALLGYWAKAGVYLPRSGEIEVVRTAPDRILAYISSYDTQSRDLWAREPFRILGTYFVEGSPLRRDGSRLVEAPSVVPTTCLLDPTEDARLGRVPEDAPTRRRRMIAGAIACNASPAAGPALSDRGRWLLFD